jgi:hypothetical protein
MHQAQRFADMDIIKPGQPTALPRRQLLLPLQRTLISVGVLSVSSVKVGTGALGFPVIP